MVKKWFQKEVLSKAKFGLGGWSKTQSPAVRRRKALSSRPKSWSAKKRYRSIARALQALANVTKDRETKIAAKEDAKYFFDKMKK